MPFEDDENAKILACSMIESEFVYCTLVWMFCSKIDMQRVEKVQYKSKKLKIHERHLQFLAIELYKSKNKLHSSFTRKTYKEKIIPYSLKKGISRVFPLYSTRKHFQATVKTKWKLAVYLLSV